MLPEILANHAIPRASAAPARQPALLQRHPVRSEHSRSGSKNLALHAARTDRAVCRGVQLVCKAL